MRIPLVRHQSLAVLGDYTAEGSAAGVFGPAILVCAAIGAAVWLLAIWKLVEIL